MISWKNPTAADRDLGMDDYLRKGVYDGARRGRRRSCRTAKSTRSVTASAARCSRSRPPRSRSEGDTRLPRVTLLAAQTDFSEPGELSLFISPSQIAMLEAHDDKSGRARAASRWAARSRCCARNDLLWQPAVNQYLKGERDRMNDLMAWNADGTRMPWRMHTEYLERLYLQERARRRAASRSTASTVDPGGHPRADVRGRHRDRSRRALEVGLQGARAHPSAPTSPSC